MKTFKKVLASALAAAMVVTAFPVTNAEAATKAKLSATKATIYVGQSKTIKVTLPAGAKISSVKTSKKAVATVKKSGKKVVVKAVKAGKATVTVKVTPKKGKAKSLKATITVKNSSISMKGTDTVTIGATESFAATVKPSVKVSYKSDATDVATVDAKGTVTGVKEGTATITATAKVGTKTVKTSKKVEIVNAITAKAVSTKKIDVTFAGAIEKAEKANFTVTDNKGVTALIKSVTLDSTKKVVTVEFYSALTSGNSYKVVVKNGEKTYEASTDYVKGNVAKIEAANQIVVAGTPSAIVYNVYDENGLDITGDTRVTFQGTVPVTNGKVNIADKVVAYMTVIYTNPSTGAQIKSAQFTITGATEVAKTIDAVTVSSGAIASDAQWPATVNTNVVNDNTATQYVSFKYTKTDGKVYYTSAGATSLNPDVLVVDAKTGKLTPVKEGTATVSAKINDVTTTFTLTVVAKAKATSLAVDATSKTTTSLTESDTSHTMTPATVKINVLDQNGKVMTSKTDALAIKVIDGDGVVSNGGAALTAAGTATTPVTGAAGTAVSFAPVKAGTTWLSITDKADATIPTIYVAITVNAADQKIAGYKFSGVKTKFDLNGQNTTPKGTTSSAIAIAAVNAAGEKVTLGTAEAISGVVISLKDSSNKELFTTPADAKTNSQGAITAKLDITQNIKAEGNYTLTATKDGIVYDSIAITVVDTSAKPSVSLKTADYKVTGANVPLTDLFDVKGAGANPTLKLVYTTSNTGIVTADTSNGVGVSTQLTLGVDATGSATLYGVKLIVTNTSTNMSYTYDFSTTPIVISK